MGLKKNFIYSAAYQMLALILPLVTAPYLSRVLGADGLGIYSYTYSIAYYFVLLAMLGVNNYGNREIARCGESIAAVRRTFWGIWTLQAVLALVALVAYCVYALFASGRPFESLVWAPYVLTALLDVNWLFFGLQRFKVTVTRNFVIKLMTFVLTFVVVRGEYALFGYLALMSGSLLVSALALWPLVLREFSPLWVGWRESLSHLKPNLVLFIPVIAVSFYTVLDKVMLGQMAGMYESGIFENALKVASMPFMFISALGTVMLPHSSRMVAAGMRESMIERMASSMWFALILSAAFTSGLIAIAPSFCPVFFGPGFDPCVSVMSLIVVEMPFMAWANVIRTQWLIPNQRDKAYVISVVVGAVSNLAANVLLIPRYGAVGAAVGTLLAEISVCLVQTIIVRRELPLRRWALESVPSWMIGIAMFGVIRLCATVVELSVLGLLVEIAVGVAFFVLCCMCWLCVSKNRYARQLTGPFLRRLKRRLRGAHFGK